MILDFIKLTVKTDHHPEQGLSALLREHPGPLAVLSISSIAVTKDSEKAKGPGLFAGSQCLISGETLTSGQQEPSLA